MKIKLLRISLLSVFAMLCSVAFAGENDLLWDYSEAAPSGNPDNNLYYGSKVNDAAKKGVKLNGSGWAAFAKAGVAGTLKLTIGLRNGDGAFAVDVCKCSNVGSSASAGELIGTVSVTESMGVGSIDIPADVTGIYIKRNTPSEGVLQKIEFKESVARTFVDFEITNEQLSGTFDPSTLPEGVTFTGNQRNDSHGYDHVTMTVPVDGTVKFTFGGCQYANPANCTVTNSEGKELATPLLKTTNCYHQTDKDLSTRAVTYIYVGEPTTLTFSNIAYLPYFKAEATEVQEAVITYKDQNGKKLGEKTVFEGDPVGEIPYTEADLTIPTGEKFRGWIYVSGKKVKPTDIVNGSLSISAKVTPIESVSVGSIQTYDLTSDTFYPEDHETISVSEGAAYYNNHGWNFGPESSFTIDVAGKAQVILTLCQYGNGTTIKVLNSAGGLVAENVPAKAESDGGTTIVQYDGAAGQLNFTFATQTYLHKIQVFNVENFVEKDPATGYYMVPAGDAASMVLALNSASGEEGAKVFLPNGTYDLGEAVLTGVSGKSVSLIGESAEKTIIVNAPPVSKEGLNTAATLFNTGSDFYMQDLTLRNDLDYYSGGTKRANAYREGGNHTVAKNVHLLSYQDTYYAITDKQYYFEDGEIHGAVDYICGGSDIYFNRVKLVNESRKKDEKNGEATMTAHQPKTAENFGYVFNECVVENNAAKFNYGRAWGGATGATKRPMATYLNTVLNQPSEIVSTRFLLAGMNTQSGVFHEYNTKDADGTVVSPTTLVETFTNNKGEDKATYEVILSVEEAANYTLDKVFPDWQPNVIAAQLEAPAATYADGNVTWTPANNGATAYMIEKNGEFAGITNGNNFSIEIDAEKDELTIRAANGRGGFGNPKVVSKTATSIKAANAAIERGEQVIYNLQGVRVNNTSKGIYIVNGRKVVIK